MTKAEIYRRAAELVASQVETFSCLAICNIVSASGPAYQLNPLARSEYEFLWDASGFLSANLCEREWGREGRVLALCFAAAMAESGDL